MSSNVSEVKRVLPELPKTVEELAKELDNVQDIRRAITSKGGKLLLEGLIGNARSALSELLRVYKTATRDELVGIIASYEAPIMLYSSIKGATVSEDDIQSLLDQAVLDSVRDLEDR